MSTIDMGHSRVEYRAAAADLANAECSVPEDHPHLEAIDALPLISPHGITAKLNAMSLDGLVTLWDGGNCWPNEWSLTDKGRAAIAAADGTRP
jgi:hypothetical protein